MARSFTASSAKKKERKTARGKEAKKTVQLRYRLFFSNVAVIFHLDKCPGNVNHCPHKSFSVMGFRSPVMDHKFEWVTNGYSAYRCLLFHSSCFILHL